MLLMMIIMSLPLLGIGLFFVLPFWAALAAYLAVLAFFVVYQALMMGAMRLPVRTGAEKILSSRAEVLNWQGNSGQVICEGEIWQAESRGQQSFERRQKVAVSGMAGLKLIVTPRKLRPGRRCSVMASEYPPPQPNELT